MFVGSLFKTNRLGLCKKDGELRRVKKCTSTDHPFRQSHVAGLALSSPGHPSFRKATNIVKTDSGSANSS